MGIDLIPAQPPRGVSTIQGNFLSPVVQSLVKEYLAEMAQRQTAGMEALLENADNNNNEIVITDRPSYIDAERAESVVSSEHVYKQISEDEGRLVDVGCLTEFWSFNISVMNYYTAFSLHFFSFILVILYFMFSIFSLLKLPFIFKLPFVT